MPSSSEGRANISRTQSQDVGPTPSDWDPSYRWVKPLHPFVIGRCSLILRAHAIPEHAQRSCDWLLCTYSFHMAITSEALMAFMFFFGGEFWEAITRATM